MSAFPNDDSSRSLPQPKPEKTVQIRLRTWCLNVYLLSLLVRADEAIKFCAEQRSPTFLRIQLNLGALTSGQVDR